MPRLKNLQQQRELRRLRRFGFDGGRLACPHSTRSNKVQQRGPVTLRSDQSVTSPAASRRRSAGGDGAALPCDLATEDDGEQAAHEDHHERSDGDREQQSCQGMDRCGAAAEHPDL